MPGDVGVFQEHEAFYLISRNRAERADDLIETASVKTEPERRKATKPHGHH